MSAARGLIGDTFPFDEIVWVLAASAVLVALLAPLTVRRYSSRSYPPEHGAIP